jgi:hypothetical protein
MVIGKRPPYHQKADRWFISVKKAGDFMKIIPIIISLSGLVIMYVGQYVKRKGTTAFIAGNNEWFVPKNEQQLAKRIGIVIILFGFETLLFPIVFYLANGIQGSHFVILATLHLLIIFFLMLADQIST